MVTSQTSTAVFMDSKLSSSNIATHAETDGPRLHLFAGVEHAQEVHKAVDLQMYSLTQLHPGPLVLTRSAVLLCDHGNLT